MKKPNLKSAKRRPGRPVSVGKGVTLTVYVPRDIIAVAIRDCGTVAQFIRVAMREKAGRDRDKM